MSIGLVTIAALLLLLPGVGFIAGVNFADKNVREIVFRNTPAEIGYVVIVSVFVHLLFACLPGSDFNTARLYEDYEGLDRTAAPPPPVPLPAARLSAIPGSAAPLPTVSDPPDKVRRLLIRSLGYFLVAALAGFVPGFFLGRRVRRGGIWRVFAKHRWMLDLAGADEEDIIYARVLLNHKFQMSGVPSEHMLIVEGILRDSYFAADGTLLYLVFRQFTELKASLEDPPYLGTLSLAGEHKASSESGQLVIEGREVAMARYQRVPLRMVVKDADLDKIEAALEQKG
jgi:hypothetical protein